MIWRNGKCCFAILLCLGSNLTSFEAQTAHHGGCRILLGIRRQMGVNVGCGAEVAVPQPFLDLLQRHPVGQQQAGAGMPEIVEADDPQPAVFQQQIEVVRQKMRRQPPTDLVDADVAVILEVIAVAAQPLYVIVLFTATPPLPSFLIEIYHIR